MDPLLRADDLILFSAGAIMDTELRSQNWPTAVLVDARFGVEEWNLGPKDQRRVSKDGPADKHFEFTYSNPPSTGNLH
jgi:hypothetical protein